MQFFKGLLKIPELYYRDKDAVQTTAKTLNTKYWLHENGSRYHILASEVTVNRITFITMYEGGETSIEDVRENCEMFIEELCSAHGSQHLDAIFAGYKKEMAEFIKANSGLESRISFFVDFPDYSGDELFGILKHLAKKDNYELGDDVYEKFMANMEMRNTQNGNGRLVRNEFEKAKLRQAQRIMGMAKKRRKEALFTLVGQDFGGEAI